MRLRFTFAAICASVAVAWACSTFDSSDETPGGADASIDAGPAPEDAADAGSPPIDAGNDVAVPLCATIDAEHCEDFDKGPYPWTFTPLVYSDAAVSFMASDASSSSPPNSVRITSGPNGFTFLAWSIPVGPNGVAGQCRFRLGTVAPAAQDVVIDLSAGDSEHGVSFGYDVSNVATMFVKTPGNPTATVPLTRAVGEWSRIELEYATTTGAVRLRVDGVEAASKAAAAVDAGTLIFSIGALTLNGATDVYVDDCAAYPE